MRRYYTRPCNFSYGNLAKNLIKKKLALPLCGNKSIAFNQIEILSRSEKPKLISIKNVSKLKKNIRKLVLEDLKKITSKRKKLNSNLNFQNPLIMGVLNLTPDSFSDGGVFNKEKKALIHIKQMINAGADIIDVGGESTRPGSTDVHPSNEWQRIKKIVVNDEPEIIYKDEIMYALGNIIQNAIFHSSKIVKVNINYSVSNVKIIITDDGTGFSKDIIDKLGEPYISKNTEGMGLGIFIAKNLIENMGGKLIFYNSKEINTVIAIIFDNSILSI